MKIIKVKSCRECYHCETRDDFKKGDCFYPFIANCGNGFMQGTAIPMDGTILPDCPLEDVPVQPTFAEELERRWPKHPIRPKSWTICEWLKAKLLNPKGE